MDDKRLRPAPSLEDSVLSSLGEMSVNRRQFMRYGFNATSGVLVATLGALGFASILLPPSGGGGGDSSVLYWAKGREDEAWYGAKHLQPMLKSDFVTAAGNSNIGMSGAQGVWNGLPVIVNYVPHEENSGTPIADNSPRFQEMAGYDIGGNYVGHATEFLLDNPEIFNPSNNLIMSFARCTHLCCIPGWQLVSNSYTDDNWTPGGGDDGGSKMFCICHSSRFDPTAIEVNRNSNRSTGASFEYIGIRRAGGPAPVGLPMIPIIMKGDTIEASSDYTGWLTYCD